MERPIEVSTPIRAAFAGARDVLLDDPGAVFGEAHTAGERHARRFRIALSVDLGAGASVQQEVALRVGVAQSTEAGFVVPVAWQAVGRQRLFPTFTGELGISKASTGTRLRLNGAYTVPLGVIGRVGNDVAGWRLARRSLAALLERLAWRLESEVDRRRESAVWRLPPDPVAPSEWEHSEIYIG
jgi:hypothetical protein